MADAPNEKGQGIVEYILILVLVAIVVLVVVKLLGPAITEMINEFMTDIRS